MRRVTPRGEPLGPATRMSDPGRATQPGLEGMALGPQPRAPAGLPGTGATTPGGLGANP